MTGSPDGDTSPAGGPAEPHSRERLGGRAAAAIFLGALLVRAIILADLSAHDPWFASPVGDERANVEDARRLLRDGFRIDEPYRAPPLYSHLLSIPLALSPGEPSDPRAMRGLAWAMKGAQALLDAGTALLIAALALRLAGRRAAYWAGAIHAVAFLPVFASAQLLDTTVATFLAVLSLRLALGATEERTAGAWVVAGTAAGLAALSRESLLLSVPVLALAPWTIPGDRGDRLRSAALLIAGAATVILPATFANHRLGGDRVLIATGAGLEFRVGNRPGGGFGADGLTRATEGPARRALQRETAHLERPSERSAHHASIARREIAAHPLRFLGRIATKAHALLHTFDVPDHKDIAEQRERSWPLRLLPGRSGVVIPLALVGIIFSRSLLRRRALLLLFLAAQSAATVAFIVSASARTPWSRSPRSPRARCSRSCRRIAPRRAVGRSSAGARSSARCSSPRIPTAGGSVSAAPRAIRSRSARRSRGRGRSRGRAAGTSAPSRSTPGTRMP